MGFFSRNFGEIRVSLSVILNLFSTKHKPDMTYFQKDCPSYGIAVRHIQCTALEGHELLLGTMHVATDIHTRVQCNILTVC
jgi:hypothetical protein